MSYRCYSALNWRSSNFSAWRYTKIPATISTTPNPVWQSKFTWSSWNTTYINQSDCRSLAIYFIRISLYYRADWSRGNVPDVYSEGGGCSLRISAGTPAVLTEVFRGFPLSLHSNSEIVPRLCRDRFLPSPLQFIRHPTIWHYIM
jgi:hypothetical protein